MTVQQQISDDTHYPKQSINLVVKVFLDDGIVKLKELPENRKNKGITLTEKGRQLCEDVIVPLLQQEEQTMVSIGETESRELIRLLELYGRIYCEQIEHLINLRVFTEKNGNLPPDMENTKNQNTGIIDALNKNR